MEQSVGRVQRQGLGSMVYSHPHWAPRIHQPQASLRGHTLEPAGVAGEASRGLRIQVDRKAARQMPQEPLLA